MNTILNPTRRIRFVAPGFAMALLASLAIDARADTDVLVGTVGQFTGPDDLHLDPALAIIAVDVFGDQDREVNGVTFRTDGQQNGGGSATEGDVTVTITAPNQINNWTIPPNFTGADPTSAANLAEIMRDIRWNGAPNPITIDIEGLAPGSPYEVQLLFNEGADRNRRFDIAVENALVVDDMTSEGLHTQVWAPDNSAYYKGVFTAPADGILNIFLQQNFGGAPPPGGDNNPILQAVIVHLDFIDVDGDGLNDPFEQKIIDADDGDAIESLADVLPSDDFDNDGLTNLEESGLAGTGTDPTNPDHDGDGTNDGGDAFPIDPDEDTDTDDDGVGDNGDNCPNDPNPDQTDTDGDGVGNVCDDDDDDDGLSDDEEAALGTSPLNADTDRDKLDDFAEINTHGTDPLDADTDDDGFRDGLEIKEGTDPLDRNDQPKGLVELYTLVCLPTGTFKFLAGGEGFDAYVHNDGTHSWLLVGRGREGWEFDADGQKSIADVGDPVLLGTPGAFAPAMYPDAVIQGLLDESGVDLTQVEIRIRRAANPEGTSYSEVRWRPIGQITWRSNFDDPQFDVEHEMVDTGGVPGGQIGVRPNGNTRDTELGGNDGDRVFTWAWDGHGRQKGFSYGSNVTTGANNETAFLWENGNENHAIPYTELYIRLENPDTPHCGGDNFGDDDEDGILDIVEFARWGNLATVDGTADQDDDGLNGADEVKIHRTDPLDDDSDDDGLKDGVETKTGTWVSAMNTGTDPNNPDTDEDGLLDGVESNTGVFRGAEDTGTNPNQVDTDFDGFADGTEIEIGCDPTNADGCHVDPTVFPVAYWPFDGNFRNEVTDDYHGTVEGPDIPFASGMFGEAAHLDGSHNIVIGGDENVFDFTGESMTVSAWFTADAITKGWQCLIGKGEGNGWRLHRRGGDNPPEMSWSGGNGDTPRNNVAISVGTDPETWHHVVGVTASETQTEILYLDGVEIARKRGAVLQNRGNPLKIGRNPDTGDRRWQGKIDDVVIWNRALGEGEITALYQAGLDGISFGELIGITRPRRLGFAIQRDENNMLELTWASEIGQLYNLRSETDPSRGDPASWPIFDGHQDLEATPPRNVLTIPYPEDPSRYFAIEAFPAPPRLILSDDLENGIGEWTAGSDGADGTAWELGRPSSGPGVAHSPVNCFATNLAGDYGLDADIWLRSPPIDLTTAVVATLAFHHFVDIEEGFDFGSVRVLNAADNTELAVIEKTVDGTDTEWTRFRRGLPAAALAKVIKLEFRFQSDNIQNFSGWYLDDIEVTVP